MVTFDADFIMEWKISFILSLLIIMIFSKSGQDFLEFGRMICTGGAAPVGTSFFLQFSPALAPASAPVLPVGFSSTGVNWRR